ncbi:ABC transporter ATP-binding protein [Microbulbifer sp. OS29]|uniref:ABC transporter ATP-binding protein n=1 Tax=Microbulbifer okhotskensis TaxID=2926617 RepID=A0A9X2EL38_9GAMM|nr:ATP-binding cassette domain-containing protein [Microbulbifer okhotskensis]MCO1334207.1 ABC transporter ATP-binding protein [Microbulbifer okhotskensis]
MLRKETTAKSVQPLLSVNNLQCCYGEQVVIESVSFALQAGEIACLLGPSGCGKTTLLHTIAGFQPVTAGDIQLSGEVISSPEIQIPAEQRKIGVVFQDYALFPHLTVEQNVAFGIKSLPKGERESRTLALLQLVRLQEFGQQYPHRLSGGQQQRVALARALAPRPKLLLLDEPFSNLDTELRRNLAAEVRHILREEKIPALIVTHDRNEAFIAGDKLGVLSQGQLQQWDNPQDTYQAPNNLAVARIVSEGNILSGTVMDNDLIKTPLGEVKLPTATCTTGDKLQLFVRSEDITAGEHPGAVIAQVVGKSFLGNQVNYRFLLAEGETIEATLNADIQAAPGDKLPLHLSSALVFGQAG